MKPGSPRALAVVALIALGGCTVYQAPPVEHPTLPAGFRNAGPWPTPPVATIDMQSSQRAGPTDRVVLLPEAGGKVGRVSVQVGEKVQEVAKAYAALDVDDKGSLKESQESEESVRRRYGALLDARPRAPSNFLLYFKSGSQDPTDESLAVIQRIRAEVDARPAAELMVIGHTDSVGPGERNQALSLRRAEFVVGLLKAAGVRAMRIEAVGRGKTDPLVPTGDERSEPRNRRTEVSVR